MVNLTFPELKETNAQALPPASEDTLKQLREEMCSQSTSRDFKLQSYQRFLRRVLSPDSPVRCLLMVHGTGTGKTCTAIQIAEEYIIRPEFQDKKVLVLAYPAVQENFKSQIFAMSKVTVEDGILLSKQCTGRRYLDMLLRIQSEPLKWTDKESRERMNTIAQRIISEFYEFQGYLVFANAINNNEEGDAWIHKTFDNRLIIIDEAHNIRNPEDGSPTKLASMALERVLKVAKNVTLVLLTATPMFDSYDEIIFYFNLFLINDRRRKALQPTDVFTKAGQFKPGMEDEFRGWCQDYVSFIRGDNPLTFPFRLPPPDDLIAPPAKKDTKNKPIPEKEQRNVLTLTQSFVQGIQAEVLKGNAPQKFGASVLLEPSICVLPENAPFRTLFKTSQEEDSQYEYTNKFLAPSTIANHSSKFALIMKILKNTKGVVFVYSNLVEMGALLFAMCLEEHGYESAIGNRVLKSTAGEIERGTVGKYILFTSSLSETERRKAIDRIKSPENVEGRDVKIIIASPSISEGVDLSYIRQVHVLECWWNMSRIEQVVGRGIRTCSHRALPFEDQNCTVYLHTCKFPDSDRETIDEFYYRTMVEAKAKSIAKVKHVIMESAMDCPLQTDINSLPKEWRNLNIQQRRSQNNTEVTFTLGEMASPLFGPTDLVCNVKESKEEDHERPLSAYLDVRDELLDKFMKLFLKKPIWKLEDLYRSPSMKMYDQDVILYTLHNAIETGFQLKDRNGRIGFLESKGSLYAFTLAEFSALQDRYIKEDKGKQIPLEVKQEETKKEITLAEKRKQLNLPDFVSGFNPIVIDWYILDHEMTREEKIQHMLTLDWENPPIYAKNLKAGNLLILGSKQIWKNGEHITPVGKDADDYYRWLKKRIDLFLETRTSFMAAMQDGRLVFNLDNESDELKRAERSKVIKGRACGSYHEPLLYTFAEWLGHPIPDSAKIKSYRCQYLALAIRQVVLDGKKEFMWWTPEEWDIFDEDENRKEILSKRKV